MPKRMFFPAAMIVIGLILIASNLGLLPMFFWNLWPVMFIVVGLGGLLLSDSEDWDGVKPAAKTASKSAKTAKKSKK